MRQATNVLIPERPQSVSSLFVVRRGCDDDIDSEIGQPFQLLRVIKIDPNFHHASIGPRGRINVEDIVFENHVADPSDLAANRFRQHSATDSRGLAEPYVRDVGLVDFCYGAHSTGITQAQYGSGTDLFA